MSANDSDSALSVSSAAANRPQDRSFTSSSTTRFSSTPSTQYHDPDQIQSPKVTEILQATIQSESSILVDSLSPSSASLSDTGYETDRVGSMASSMISFRSGDFIYENGRRYHVFREGAYNFPNEESEQDREDMKHAMMTSLCQVLHFAPIGPNPQSILDMGTGTGIWAIEMGDLYPSANVVGVDLSPIQPMWVPPNVKFVVDDVESPWLHPKNHFDYIHSRHLIMAIRDWDKLMENAYLHLKPGAWYEIQEIQHVPSSHDSSLPPNHPLVTYWSHISAGLSSLGISFTSTPTLASKMSSAGFINVTERIFHVPIGKWPKNKILKMIGLCWKTVLMDGVLSIAMGPLTRGLGWSREEVEEWVERTVGRGGEVGYGEELEGVHAHMALHIVYGQKPEENRC